MANGMTAAQKNNAIIDGPVLRCGLEEMFTCALTVFSWFAKFKL